MDIEEIPFPRLVGVVRAEGGGERFLLPDAPKLANHLGTVHAAAQFALAEACSGGLLLTRFADLAEEVVPVLRRAAAKYRLPAVGRLTAEPSIPEDGEARLRLELARHGRAQITVSVTVRDAVGRETLTADFQWFIQRKGGE